MKIIKNILVFFTLIFITGCTNKNAVDCFQAAGNTIKYEIVVPEFTKLTVFENLNVVIKQGEVAMVEVETGENLSNDVKAIVNDGMLTLTNTNECNFVRDYYLTTFYITVPNLTEIRSSTGGLIKSEGVLNFPNVSLLSENYHNPDADTTVGSFELQLQSESVSIVVNGKAYMKLGGETNTLKISSSAGDSRLECQELIANNVYVTHRGSNDIFVHPVASVSGKLWSIGNLICVNTPTVIDVEAFYIGEILFVD